ncbi:unnamed protein product, partial [marine sediment metagenome]
GLNSPLPEVAPKNKIEKIKENKAEVIIKGKTYDDACSYAHSLSKKTGNACPTGRMISHLLYFEFCILPAIIPCI